MKRVWVCLAVFCIASVDARAQQEGHPRASVTVSAGQTRLARFPVSDDSTTLDIGARLGVRLLPRIGVETDVTRSGLVEGAPYARRHDWRLRHDRRETVVTIGLRGYAWSWRSISIEPVAGLAFIRTDERRYSSSYNPLIARWSEWRLSEDRPDPPRNVAVSIGVDVPVGTRRFAMVPEVRLRLKTDSDSQTNLTDHMRIAIGLRAGF